MTIREKEKIILNAKVYIRRGVFASAVLIRDGLIAGVGTERAVLDAARVGAEKIDAGGGLVLPGFFDSHLHLIDTGRMTKIIDFSGISSIENVIDHAKKEIERLKPPKGSFVRGDCLNQEDFTGEKRFPSCADLDKITTDHALFITRVCGHIGFCNSKTLEALGLSTGESGQTDGVLRGENLVRARNLAPPETDAETRENLREGVKLALENGITSIGTCDIIQPRNFSRILEAYRSLYQEQTPNIRAFLQCGVFGDPDYLDEYIRNGLITGAKLFGDFLTMGSLKLFADGSLGARTACLRRPYLDDPDTSGVPEMDWALMKELIKKAHKNGIQTMVHAIGDASIEEVIQDFEELDDPHNKTRHGIIHCQITDKKLLSRMARSNILALVQPVFLAHDLFIVEKRVGAELAASSYAWGTMEKLGIRAAYGADSPVEPVNPLLGIACAVSRKNFSKNYPENGFFHEECVDIFSAVDNYTASGAYAHFSENRLGRIQTGAYADLVLLDRDIFTIHPEEILSSRVLWTMVNGEILFSRKKF